MTPLTMLRLGRVSNLPTVWTNALAGGVLAGATSPWPVAGAALALSLFYVGGMWLNDAFDAGVDARERPSRPIPSGAAALGTVFAVGLALLAGGVAVAALLGAPLMGAALAGAILLYDWLHKRTVLSPVIMAATRFLAWGLGAAAVGAFAGAPLWGAAGLACYVVGLTYAAKQEAYDRLDRAWPLGVLAVPVLYAGWHALGSFEALPLFLALIGVIVYALLLLTRRAKGDVPRAVVTLIAGIALYDAVLIAASGAMGLATLALACFGLTLLLQRVVPGT